MTPSAPLPQSPSLPPLQDDNGEQPLPSDDPSTKSTMTTTTNESNNYEMKNGNDNSPNNTTDSSNGENVVDSSDDISSLTKGLGSVTIFDYSRKDDPQSDSIAAPTISAATQISTPSPLPAPPVPQAVQQIATLLASNKYTNIIVLTGAGISVSAGIPDFRSPNTGLYDNLSKYNLPYPEAVFDLEYYKSNPQPFIQLAAELWPGIHHSPTITHSFIALLERKGMLLRNYTQNIDCLDVQAGVSETSMIECHGHFRSASCTKCHSPYDESECRRQIVTLQTVPICTRCGGHVKPDIVFFGEDLPQKFHTCLKNDMQQADLLLVMGTSLMVSPVNMIPNMVSNKCIRILLNNECVGSFAKCSPPNKNRMITRKSSSSGNIIAKKSRDIFHPGDCDTSIRTLCNVLGWTKELEELNQSTHLGRDDKEELLKVIIK